MIGQKTRNNKTVFDAIIAGHVEGKVHSQSGEYMNKMTDDLNVKKTVSLSIK